MLTAYLVAGMFVFNIFFVLFMWFRSSLKKCNHEWMPEEVYVRNAVSLPREYGVRGQCAKCEVYSNEI